MPEVILYVAASLDGFIARPNGAVDWLDRFNEPDEDYGYAEFMKGVGAIIMGAGTYQWMIDYGTWLYGELPTFVMTNRSFDKMAAPIRFRSGAVAPVIEEMKNLTDKHIWVAGGGVLTQEMIRERLIDRMIISIIPALIGDGISLFGNLKAELSPKLVRSSSFDCGIVQVEYRIEHA